MKYKNKRQNKTKKKNKSQKLIKIKADIDGTQKGKNVVDI